MSPMNNQQPPTVPIPIEVPETVYRPFFTPKALARYFTVSERTVWQLLADREIESVRVAGSRRIPAEAVDEYLKRNRTPATR
jgi:excisionase family DNA binding protein